MTKTKLTIRWVAVALIAHLGPQAFIGCPHRASAETLHHWRFEEPGFLVDRVGGVVLEPFDMGPVSLPSEDRGTSFPTFVGGYGPNRSAADSTGRLAGGLAENTTTIEDALTIELFAHFDTLARADTSRSMLAAQSNFPRQGSGLSWALGVERKGGNQRAQRRELHLWAHDGVRPQAELITSGIFIQEETDYFLSASFDAADKEVRFYVTNLSTGESQMELRNHSLDELYPQSTFGVMWPEDWSRVDGIVDEVRLSRGVVDVEKLLVNLPAGDFNHNGALDVGDVDLLTQESAARLNSNRFDLTGDRLVDQEDIIDWVKNRARSWMGDADVDGEFNSADLVAVFTAGQYEDGIPLNSVWSTGDWDGNGEFDSSDVVVAFSDGGYEQGPQPAANAVPEPASIVVLLVGLVVITIGRRPIGRRSEIAPGCH